MPGMDRVIARALEVQGLQRAGLETGLKRAMELIAYYARTEHTYTRQTGNTERTTEGGIYLSTARALVGVVSAGMSYDRFLEAARDGEWSFLWPALMAHADEVMDLIAAGGSLGPFRK